MKLITPNTFTTASACAVLVSTLTSAAALAQDFVMDGQAGFVVSSIRYALSHDAAETGACPEGMTQGYANKGDVFVGRDDLQQREGEKEDLYIRRMFGVAFSGDEEVRNLCLNPELGKPDPRFRTVSGKNVPVYGIDMDGVDSQGDAAAPGTCAHDDFPGMNGESGIDNQFFRAVGCLDSFQSTGLSNTYETEMLTGSWGILMTLSGVDDIVNDEAVEVGFFANNDPIQLSPTREPLSWATYSMYPDARYQARARGRIRDGVLTTDPVDMRFHWVVNSIRVDRPLQRARVQMTLNEEGVLEGYLAGYTNVEDLYSFKFGYRNGTDGTGELAPLRLRAGSSIGKAFVLGYTCEGAYYALHEHADADPDPQTGACTSLSTQYQIRAIPAFVVEEASGGSNEALDSAGYRRADDYTTDSPGGEQ